MRFGRPKDVWERVRSDLVAALLEEQSAHVVAVSFAVGVFITALPTLGTGLLVMAALVYLFSYVNKIALFAAVVVLNPIVKSAVYVASFGLGSYVLGPVPDVFTVDISLTAGPQIVSRLLLGNVILAVVFSVVGYGLARWTVRTVRRRGVSAGSYLPDSLSE